MERCNKCGEYGTYFNSFCPHCDNQESELIIQLVRIGDILDLESVDCRGYTVYDLLANTTQNEVMPLKSIHDSLDEFGFWKATTIYMKHEYGLDESVKMLQGDGHHRTCLLYLLLGEDAYIPVSFNELSYMNANHSFAPCKSPETFDVPFTLDELTNLV